MSTILTSSSPSVTPSASPSVPNITAIAAGSVGGLVGLALILLVLITWYMASHGSFFSLRRQFINIPCYSSTISHVDMSISKLTTASCPIQCGGLFVEGS